MISAAYLGSDQQSKVYLGSELIIGTEPADHLAIAPAEDQPVITTQALSQWGPPSIASDGWWRERRTGYAETPVGGAQTATTGLDVSGSSYFDYPCSQGAVAHPANPGGYVTTEFKPGGDSQNAHWLFNVRFVTSSPTVELRFRSSVADPDLGLVLVNGKRIQERTVTQTLGEAGIGYSTVLTFPDERPREITIYGLNNVSGNFGGVAVAPGHTVSRPLSHPSKSVAIIGDSYVNGHATVSASETFVWKLALAMGADCIMQAGIGGTGFTAGDANGSSFAYRVGDVMQLMPDVLIFAGGRNDAASSQLAGRVASVAYDLNVPVIVIPTASESSQGAVRSAIQEGATAVGARYLDVDIDALDKIADGIHPTWAAHQQLADQAYDLYTNPPPTLVDMTTATQQSGTSITIPVPEDAEAGDLLVVAHGDQSNVTSSYPGNAGWTKLGPEFEPQSSGGRVIGLWAKWHTGAEPESYEFTRTGAATRSVAAMTAWRGVALDYLDDAVTNYEGTDVTDGKETESLTATRNGVQVFFARAEFTDGHSSAPTSPPLGFTEAASWQTGTGTTASRSGGWLGYRTVTAGETGTSAITWGSPSAPSAQSLILRGRQQG